MYTFPSSESKKAYAIVIYLTYRGTANSLPNTKADAIHLVDYYVNTLQIDPSDVYIFTDDPLVSNSEFFGVENLTRINVKNPAASDGLEAFLEYAFKSIILPENELESREEVVTGKLVEETSEYRKVANLAKIVKIKQYRPFSVFMSVSSHGTRVPAGADAALEANGKDSAIFIGRNGIMRDDAFNRIFTSLPKEAEIFALCDLCYSGTVFDLPYVYERTTKYTKSYDKITAKIVCLGSSRDTQVSWEVGSSTLGFTGGALTIAFLETMRNLSDKRITLPTLSDVARRVAKSTQNMQSALLSSSFDIAGPTASREEVESLTTIQETTRATSDSSSSSSSNYAFFAILLILLILVIVAAVIITRSNVGPWVSLRGN